MKKIERIDKNDKYERIYPKPKIQKDIIVDKQIEGGLGRMGGQAAGLGGKCICPQCGHTISHKRAEPCDEIQCPKCGAKMGRAGDTADIKEPEIKSGFYRSKSNDLLLVDSQGNVAKIDFKL